MRSTAATTPPRDPGGGRCTDAVYRDPSAAAEPDETKAGPEVSVLDDILVGVREDLAERQAATPLEVLKERAAKLPAARDGIAALKQDGVAVIAEVKRSSP